MVLRRAVARLPVVLVSVAVSVVGVGMAVAWTAGWHLEAVLTGSMEPEVPDGSLALTRPVSATNIEVGEVVSYHDPSRPGNPVLHRVISIVDRSGARFFEFQGDANNAPDTLLVPEERIRNELLWHVPRLGDATAWLVVGWRRWLVAVVPAALSLAGWAARRRRSRRVDAPSSDPSTGSCPHCPHCAAAEPAPASPVPPAPAVAGAPS